MSTRFLVRPDVCIKLLSKLILSHSACLVFWFWQSTAWCSEIGSLASLDAPAFHAFSDVREPISLHQAVLVPVDSYQPTPASPNLQVGIWLQGQEATLLADVGRTGGDETKTNDARLLKVSSKKSVWTCKLNWAKHFHDIKLVSRVKTFSHSIAYVVSLRGVSLFMSERPAMVCGMKLKDKEEKLSPVNLKLKPIEREREGIFLRCIFQFDEIQQLRQISTLHLFIEPTKVFSFSKLPRLAMSAAYLTVSCSLWKRWGFQGNAESCHITWEEYMDKFKCREAKCEKTLKKSGLEPTASKRPADRNHCALSTQPNPHQVDGDFAELIKRSASDRLGAIWCRRFEPGLFQGFFTTFGL